MADVEMDVDDEDFDVGAGGPSHPATLAAIERDRLARLAEQQENGLATGNEDDPMVTYKSEMGSGVVNTRIVDREDGVRLYVNWVCLLVSRLLEQPRPKIRCILISSCSIKDADSCATNLLIMRRVGIRLPCKRS